MSTTAATVRATVARSVEPGATRPALDVARNGGAPARPPSSTSPPRPALDVGPVDAPLPSSPWGPSSPCAARSGPCGPFGPDGPTAARSSLSSSLSGPCGPLSTSSPWGPSSLSGPCAARSGPWGPSSTCGPTAARSSLSSSLCGPCAARGGPWGPWGPWGPSSTSSTSSGPVCGPLSTVGPCGPSSTSPRAARRTALDVAGPRSTAVTALLSAALSTAQSVDTSRRPFVTGRETFAFLTPNLPSDQLELAGVEASGHQARNADHGPRVSCLHATTAFEKAGCTDRTPSVILPHDNPTTRK
jgi:hypothetical protein